VCTGLELCRISVFRLIEYKLMSLINKVLATTQPDYLHNLIFISAAALTLLFISCHLSSLLDRQRVPRYHHEPFYSSCIFTSLYLISFPLYSISLIPITPLIHFITLAVAIHHTLTFVHIADYDVEICFPSVCLSVCHTQTAK